MFNTKGGINNVSNIILQHPSKWGVQVRVHALNVRQIDGFVEKHFVERHGKSTINVMPVKNCNAWNFIFLYFKLSLEVVLRLFYYKKKNITKINKAFLHKIILFFDYLWFFQQNGSKKDDQGLWRSLDLFEGCKYHLD